MKVFSNRRNRIMILMILVTVIFLTGIKSYFNLNPLEAEAVEQSKPLVLNWLSYDEGLIKAEKEDKYILVFFYSDGCGWCDKMEREVYKNKEVKQLLAGKFVSVKINASSNNKIEVNGEDITEKAFALSFQVTGYPTTWFMENKDKKIAPLPGYVPAEQFITVLKYIGEDWYKTKTFQEYVESIKS